MPSPPCDGGTHLPSPGTSPSNDAISRGSSDGGGGDGRGSGDSAIGAAGDSPRGEVIFLLLLFVEWFLVDHACAMVVLMLLCSNRGLGDCSLFCVGLGCWRFWECFSLICEQWCWNILTDYFTSWAILLIPFPLFFKRHFSEAFYFSAA